MISLASISLDGDSIKAVSDVLKSGQLAEGPIVQKFERVFADYVGTKYAIAVNSGTAALHVALLASGIGPGDEVVTTPFTFIASANCCLFCGAVPIFADIDGKTFNIAPSLIEKKITTKTKAIIVVHLYGQSCDMDEILYICRKNDLVLIEDACQAHGAEYDGCKTGSFGIGCFSFYPTKNMTTGEGGMLTTDDEGVAKKAKAIRNHGRSQQYVHDVLGYNFRMTDIAAALGICQLNNLDKANKKRMENAIFLSSRIETIKGIISPHIAPKRNHVFNQYTVKVTGEFKLSRDELQHRLNQENIGSAVYYPMPIHKQPLYQNLGYSDYLPIAEETAKEVLSLPIHPNLNHEDLKAIYQALKDV